MNYISIEGYQDYQEGGSYGFFGYASAVVHSAISRDDAKSLRKMIDANYITRESKTLDNLSMREFCVRSNAVKCAKLFE